MEFERFIEPLQASLEGNFSFSKQFLECQHVLFFYSVQESTEGTQRSYG
jgi:hypothetical protein